MKFFNHPKGLYLLFSTEMWERFSYYGMRTILVLYLTDSLIKGGLSMDPQAATMLYGIFTGLVYFTPMIGGWLADNYLGQRKSIVIGGTLMMLGNLFLWARQDPAFMYIGLALIILGNGFFKPNISVMVGRLYPEGDSRIDSAFTIFYMGINLGAFFSPLVAGTLSNYYGYRWGFFSAAVGLFIGQLIYHFFAKDCLGEIGNAPSKKTKSITADAPKALTKEEKDRTYSMLILTVFAIIFFAGYEQAGSSMTLFTENHIDRTIGSFEVPTAWFLAINPAFIMIFAPILSMLSTRMASKGKEWSIPVKMGIGLVLLGAGFVVLMWGITLMGGEAEGHRTSMWIIVLTLLLHTLGELYVSPIGLSMVSRLSPVKIASLMMGIWFFATAFANILSGYLASVGQEKGDFPVFAFLAGISIFAGIVLICIRKPIRRLSHGNL